MNVFNGTPISELRLLEHGVVFTLLFLGLMIVLGFWMYASLPMKNPKEKKRLRKLKEKAKEDDLSKKRLNKIERKNMRRRKREKENIITDIVLWSISVCLGIVILTWAIIPAWTDYIKKDYVVYTGEITVYQQTRNSRIELDDGTIVRGRGEFDSEDTYGTVVYSRRTKQFLGGNNE